MLYNTATMNSSLTYYFHNGLSVRYMFNEYLQIGKCGSHCMGRAVAAASSLKANHNGIDSGANAILFRTAWTVEFRKDRQV